VLGQERFEAIENHRGDDYFKAALSIRQVPPAPASDNVWTSMLTPYYPSFIKAILIFWSTPKSRDTVDHRPCGAGYRCLSHEQRKTRKEGVSRTYKGFDGYAPIALYLGKEGWCLGNELREGKQHCQHEFLYSLERGLAAAKRLTSLPLLVRLDSGHDALDNRIVLAEDEQTDFIIKWNPRKQDVDAWLAYASSSRLTGLCLARANELHCLALRNNTAVTAKPTAVAESCKSPSA